MIIMSEDIRTYKPMRLYDFPRFNLKSKEGLADRKVPAQPLVYYNKDGKVSRYNLRKVSHVFLDFD